MSVNFRKVAVVGCGFVGSSSAFALMDSGMFSEMVLIDVMKEKAEGEAMDIGHGTALTSPMNIYAGDYADAKDAAIIVVTAGGNAAVKKIKDMGILFYTQKPLVPTKLQKEIIKCLKYHENT